VTIDNFHGTTFRVVKAHIGLLQMSGHEIDPCWVQQAVRPEEVRVGTEDIPKLLYDRMQTFYAIR